MTQTDLFTKLGAPLANSRWSWGSVRLDGTIFLRVWQDRTREHDGSWYMQITHQEKFRNDPDNLGYQERLRHVELIKQGAPVYMIMCVAVDVDAVPRKVKDFDQDDVFAGGKIVELDGDWWVERGPRVQVRHVIV